MKPWFLNCNRISELVSESMDADTGVTRRIGIKFHIMMCRYCARYEKQLHTIRDTIKTSVDESSDVSLQPMSDQKKKQIKIFLNNDDCIG